MSDNVDNFTHEWMRRQDKRMDRLFEHLAEIKTQLNAIEKGVLALRRDSVATDEAAAQQRLQHERLVERVERIERRLELADEHKEG
jgi:hypothetical protein